MAIKKRDDLEPNYGVSGSAVEKTITPQYKSTVTYPTGTDFGEYKNQWQDQLDDYMSMIMNRPAFSYDLNGDALYKQYRDQAIRNGRLAMQDTVGQVSALTGGYGNSYAASAGQQQYNAYLGQLNDKVPELYSLARGAYDADTQNLIQQYGILQDREKQDYDRYMDAYSMWKAAHSGGGGGSGSGSVASGGGANILANISAETFRRLIGSGSLGEDTVGNYLTSLMQNGSITEEEAEELWNLSKSNNSKQGNVKEGKAKKDIYRVN